MVTCGHTNGSLLMPIRDAIRVTTKFKDFFKHWVTDPNHPYKINLGQLATLTVLKFYKRYQNSSEEEKKKLFEDLKQLKSEAETKGFLKNSKEISENENE